MSLINENDLKIIEEKTNFEKFDDTKARFNTKVVSGMRHNYEVVDVLGVVRGRDSEHDAYVVRYNDGLIDDNVWKMELEFDYPIDLPAEDSRRILSKLMRKYDLSDNEAIELYNASLNYDYEANEGTVFSTVESVKNLFMDEECEQRINPTDKQLKAMAEYIRDTEKYYLLYDYEKYAEKTIELILNDDEPEILEENENLDLPEHYSLDEIEDLLKNNERLVYVDDGYDEFVIKYTDLPDCIVDTCLRDMSKELKVIDYKKLETIATTYGYFLNKCDPKVREDIIDRLQKLQLGEEEVKPYKVIFEDMLEEVEDKMQDSKKHDRDGR